MLDPGWMNNWMKQTEGLKYFIKYPLHCFMLVVLCLLVLVYVVLAMLQTHASVDFFALHFVLPYPYAHAYDASKNQASN